MNPIEEKEKIYIEGYKKTPEELKMAKASAKLAPEVLNKESWLPKQ